MSSWDPSPPEGPPSWNAVMRELHTALSNPASETGSLDSVPGAPWNDDGGDGSSQGPDYEDLSFGEPPPYLAGPAEEGGWPGAAPDPAGGWPSGVGPPPNFPPPPPFQPPPLPPPAGPEANAAPLMTGGEGKGRWAGEGLAGSAGAGEGQGGPLPRPDWRSPAGALGDGKVSVRRLLIREMRQRFTGSAQDPDNADRDVPADGGAQQVGKPPPAAQLVKWPYFLCIIFTILLVGGAISYVLYVKLKCK